MHSRSDTSQQVVWLIDLHGLYDALSSRSNSKARVLDAIKAGEMKVIASAGQELKELYPELWDDFSDIKVRKYEKPSKFDHDLAAHLQEMYGSSIIGGIPTYDQFIAIAMAARLGANLVTAGKAKKRCDQILQKNPSIRINVVGISNV